MLLEFFPDGYMLSISNISPPIKYTLPFEFSFFFLFTSCLFQSSSWNITSLVLIINSLAILWLPFEGEVALRVAPGTGPESCRIALWDFFYLVSWATTSSL